MTFYLIDMLELLSAGQEGIIEALGINLSKMERIIEFFKRDTWRKRREEANLLRKMTFLHVFVDDEVHFPITRLMKLEGKSRYKVNNIMSNLEAEEYVKLVSHRPIEYKVADEFLARK